MPEAQEVVLAESHSEDGTGDESEDGVEDLPDGDVGHDARAVGMEDGHARLGAHAGMDEPYRILRGRVPQELLAKLSQKAKGLTWRSLERLAKTQPDGLRRIFKLGANGSLHRSCCSFGKEVMAECGVADCPVYKPVLILTRPGAKRQVFHEYANAMDAYSIVIAVTDRRFVFKHLRDPIQLRAGDVLVFKASICHAGAPLDAEARLSVGLHMYCGRGILPHHRDRTFPCPEAELDPSALGLPPYVRGDLVEVDFTIDPHAPGWYGGVVTSCGRSGGEWICAIDYDDGTYESAVNCDDMRWLYDGQVGAANGSAM